MDNNDNTYGCHKGEPKLPENDKIRAVKLGLQLAASNFHGK